MRAVRGDRLIVLESHGWFELSFRPDLGLP